MGLISYGLWVMGQLDSNVQSPTAPASLFRRRSRIPAPHLRGVALQVAFERQTLKPVFSLDRL
jgi:hypothetical protein